MQHKILNVRISDNICSVNNEMCKFNSTEICYSCIIMSGNIKFPIKFVPGLKIPKPQPDMKPSQSVFNAKELVLPKVPDLKITLPSLEDDEDKPNFVNFLSNGITHVHSNNMMKHSHYPINEDNIFSGLRCQICGFPTRCDHICSYCDSMFNSKECFVLTEKQEQWKKIKI
jgi:hypothetical protein